jgi:NAD(P)-dependent dehydrogenase (short-subunit alcohol dehydrogenase family)
LSGAPGFAVRLCGASTLVIGGARRLGRATALALARAGANVAISTLGSESAARETVGEIAALGVESFALRADAADRGDVDRVLHAVDERFGGLDLLVANAGAFRRTPLEEVREEDWEEMLRANLETLRIPALSAAPLLGRAGGGSIVALADVAGIRPWADYVPYSVAKSYVMALTRALAIDLAPSIRVNAVAPGPILFPDNYPAEAREREVRRTLLRRAGDPSNVATAVLFLAENDYVTGVVLPVDGGRLYA